MKRIVVISLVVAAVLVLNSCYKNLDKVLFGIWSVTKVEGTLNQNGSSVFSATDDNPTGTVEFKNSGKGEQNYTFTFDDTVSTQIGTFTWQADEDEITIDRVTQPNMNWSRIINTDNRQKVSYNIVVNANQNWDYTLTLEK
jgi:hypothetical protein